MACGPSTPEATAAKICLPVQDGLRGPLVLAGWTPEVRSSVIAAADSNNVVNATITAVKLRAAAGSDIAVALADGWVVGTSLDGERWGLHIAGADGLPPALAALDLDDDGARELIIASGKTVSAWTWNGHAARGAQ
jgi:hypothetical protein